MKKTKTEILREVGLKNKEEVLRELELSTRTKVKTIETKEREIVLLWAAVNLVNLES